MADDLTLLATTHDPRCAVHIDKFLVGYHTIQYMATGGVLVGFGERTWRLEGDGGWFWPANPGPRVRFHVAPPYAHWFHRHVGFAGPRVRRWQALGLLMDAPQPAPPGTDWPAFLDELIAAACRPDALSQLRGVNLLERLLLELSRARRAGTDADVAEPEWLTAARDALTRAGSFAPDYTGVAESLGMSPSTLRRRFRAATGLSPQEYVVQERVARARALLTETDEPLKAIAERLGYESVYFFARQFRLHAGVTPGTYRRSRHR